MSIEVKEEFKSLIGDLSKEICDKALKTDIDKLNEDIHDLESIADEYRNIQGLYNKVLQGFLRNNAEIVEFKKSLNGTNIALGSALEKVDMTQVKIFKKMMESNDESLAEYKRAVKLLNESEREKLKNLVEISIKLKMEENNKELNKSFNEVLLRIKNNNELLEKLNNRLEEIVIVNKKIEDIASNCREKIELVEEKSDKKMQYLMILISISIILNIVGIFIK